MTLMKSKKQWIQKYFRLMFLSGKSIEEFAKAAVLKYENMPGHIYKYRTFCENHINALKNGELYFTSTGCLNDITEANIVITDRAKENLHQRIYNETKDTFGLPSARVTNFTELCSVISRFYKEKTGSDKELDFTNTEEFQIYKKIFCNFN